MAKVLVACSGGLKSAFLVAAAVKEDGAENVELVYIGHNNAANDSEQDACTKLATHYHLPNPHLIVMWKSEPGWPIFKTTLMYWYLLMYGRANRFKRIYLGYHSDRHTKEMTEEFVDKLRMLTETIQPMTDGCGFYIPRAEIEIPLIRLDLKRILRLGADYAVPWHLTWSCENTSHYHCGTCVSCVRRQHAFILAGMLDPTTYLEPLARRGEPKHAPQRRSTGDRSIDQRVGVCDTAEVSKSVMPGPDSVGRDIGTGLDTEVPLVSSSDLDASAPDHTASRANTHSCSGD